MKSRILVLLFAFFFCSTLASSVLAQQTPNLESSPSTTTATPAAPTTIPAPTSPLQLTVSPVSLLLETDPSKPVTSSFQVFNNGTQTEFLKVELLKFTADQTGAQPVIRVFDADDEYQHWISFSSPTFSVEPKTWKTTQLVFSPPEDAALSYYYAIMITRQSSPAVSEGETGIVGAPAILTLATVRSPLVKQELQLKSFRTTKRVFEFLPVEFELVVQNTGNIHLAPVGNVFINDAKGEDVGQIELNRNNGLILPGGTRTYTLQWDVGFPRFVPKQENGAVVQDGNGKPKTKLEWDFSKANVFRMGQYTAHLVFIYDNGERDIPTEARVNFMVGPWRILAAVGIVALLILIGISAPIVWLLRRTKTATKK